jgi:AraC-like DNA-binding protein
VGNPRLSDERRLLCARDLIDRRYAGPLDIEALAKSVHLSRAHFIRSFRATFGETPHRYLQRRRVERAMAMLRETETPITMICLDVGFASLGSFSRTFSEIVGCSPTAYRRQPQSRERMRVPSCFAMAWDRPSSTFREAGRAGRI